MRFGHWRGVTLAVALLITASFGLKSTAHAGLIFHRVIPRDAPAIDYRTGQVMFAPPVPYGHYAKDYVGCVTGLPGGLCAHARGLLHGGLLHGGGGSCSSCGGAGCKSCGNDPVCQGCGGNGCSMCGGHGRILGFFGHKKDADCGLCGGEPGCFSGHVGGKLCGPGQSCGATLASAQAAPSAQIVAESACGNCLGKGCGLCGGRGKLRGLFHHGNGDPCGACGGKGCGLCGGRGGLGHGGDACGSCGGKGCGLCGGSGLGGLCRACGGAGCALCGKARGLLAKLTHAGYIKYFVGPGGPVPITPGYVPYVVSTRSPRHFFAFPPMSNSQP